MKNFYSDFVVIETLINELDSMDLSDGERAHLAALIDSSLHSVILDEVLSHLSDEDKELFLEKLENKKEHKEIMDFLNEKVDNIEDKIKTVSDQLVKELHEDLKEAKKQ